MIGIIRSSDDEAIATKAGAHEVVRNDEKLTAGVRALAPKGVDHIIEVAFGANMEADLVLGSDDFPRDAKVLAAKDLNAALEAGWSGFDIAERIPLPEIARAHELAEHPVRRGRLL